MPKKGCHRYPYVTKCIRTYANMTLVTGGEWKEERKEGSRSNIKEGLSQMLNYTSLAVIKYTALHLHNKSYH